MTVSGKIRACAKTVLYWAKHMSEPNAAHNRDYFYNAMVGHLVVVEKEKIALPQDVVALSNRARNVML